MSSSDQVIWAAREKRKLQIEECSRRASKKILAKLKSGRLSAEALAELITGEFQELVG